MVAEIIAVIILEFIVVGLLIERYLYSQQVNEQNEKYMKAVMSRNINDYLSATADKGKGKQEFIQTDEVDMERLSDDEFKEMIDKQNGV